MYNSNTKFTEKTYKMVTELISQWDMQNSLSLCILNPDNGDKKAMVVQGTKLSGLLWSSTLNGFSYSK